MFIAVEPFGEWCRARVRTGDREWRSWCRSTTCRCRRGTPRTATGHERSRRAPTRRGEQHRSQRSRRRRRACARRAETSAANRRGVRRDRRSWCPPSRRPPGRHYGLGRLRRLPGVDWFARFTSVDRLGRFVRPSEPRSGLGVALGRRGYVAGYARPSRSYRRRRGIVAHVARAGTLTAARRRHPSHVPRLVHRAG